MLMDMEDRVKRGARHEGLFPRDGGSDRPCLDQTPA